ncbi:MAG: hypothetical protein Q9227_000433 [Pyrenula ochraceoflavens]
MANVPGRSAIHALPSPAPSHAASTSDSVDLPAPRSHPLKPGSQKESAFINYVDAKILNLNRRYAKKFGGEVEEGTGRGYQSFAEVAADVEAVFDVVWVSGTLEKENPRLRQDYDDCLFLQPTRGLQGNPTSLPGLTPLKASLQVPYLLSLATLLCSYAEPFPFDSDPTFHMVGKLDRAFASLLQCPPLNPSNVDTRCRTVSLTEQVRIRSLAELTRLSLVQKLQSEKHSDHRVADESEIDDENATTTDADESGIDLGEPDEGYSRLLLAVSELYMQTLELLGDSLIPTTS